MLRLFCLFDVFTICLFIAFANKKNPAGEAVTSK